MRENINDGLHDFDREVWIEQIILDRVEEMEGDDDGLC
jgi:hypothetical protein